MSACDVTTVAAGTCVGSTLQNPVGLRFVFAESGGLETIDDGRVRINLVDGTPLSDVGANLYLRRRATAGTASSIPLLGPLAPGALYTDGRTAATRGQWQGLEFAARLVLAERYCTWLWDVVVRNRGDAPGTFDLIHVQDVGLGPTNTGDQNIHVLSQYIDYTVLEHSDHGAIVCCRQNHHGPGCTPWLALGAVGGVDSFSTDGLQFYGSDFRSTGMAAGRVGVHLPGQLQGELAAVVLQSRPVTLEPGASHRLGFYGVFQRDHPVPTNAGDLIAVDAAVGELTTAAAVSTPTAEVFEIRRARSLFATAPLLQAEALTAADVDALFGTSRRHAEFVDGRLLSFFGSDGQHVVLREKELLVNRPHGHIMRTGIELTPDERSLNSTAYMLGVFHAHVAQGNVNNNRLLSVFNDPVGLVRHTGQRIFIHGNGRYVQLGVPSAFEMHHDGCRWIYKLGESCFEVRSQASSERPELTLEARVLSGDAPDWLVTSDLAAEHGWRVEQVDNTPGGKCVRLVPGADSDLRNEYPDGGFRLHAECPSGNVQIGGDERLFDDGQSRQLPCVVMGFAAAESWCVRISGHLPEANGATAPDAKSPAASWKSLSRGLALDARAAAQPKELGRLAEILPWFAQNALVHLLTPHGLEQHGGGAWGTRDICQGPLELLLSMGHYREARSILRTVLVNQNPDGGWPQWWMFDRYHHIRAGDAHGDIIFWPILAVCEYIRAADDIAFLDVDVPFYTADALGMDSAPVAEHLRRAIRHITQHQMIAGTALVALGEGDWNDAMQPADAALKNRLVSAWTVGLCYQTLRAYADVCRIAGRKSVADETAALCDRIQRDFDEYLVRDDVVAGYGHFDGGSEFDLLLHPSDDATGIHYRLLPMIRGIISEIFTPAQAAHHADVIADRLLGPDGARLMDRPPRYRGGQKTYFQRGETAAFFGREIGLMYTHAHLRYAEALARLGRADAFARALQQVIPIGLRDVVSMADLRQSNCYYSSSDARLTSRYEVDERYDELVTGQIPLHGGWRVYSSGPGIFVRLVVGHLLGIRHRLNKTVFDPVLPNKYSGLRVNWILCDRPVAIVYHAAADRVGPTRIGINGVDQSFAREANPYRTGGAVLDDEALRAALNSDSNIIEVHV